MSNLLPQSNSNALSAQIPETFTRAEGKELLKLQNREIARGLVAGTRVQAAGMVAALGMQTTAMLSREAMFQADGDPTTMNRERFSGVNATVPAASADGDRIEVSVADGRGHPGDLLSSVLARAVAFVEALEQEAAEVGSYSVPERIRVRDRARFRPRVADVIADPAAAVALIVSIAVIAYAMFDVAILIVAVLDWAITETRRRREQHRQLELLRRETERELLRIEADTEAVVQRIETAFVAAQQALRSGQRPVSRVEELS
eukprot:gene22668-27185_t